MFRSRPAFCAVVTAVVGAWGLSALAEPPMYRAHQIPIEGHGLQVADLNNASQVCGHHNESGQYVGFVYSPTGGTVDDIGSLYGYHTMCKAINDLGQIVGGSSVETGTWKPFLWTPPGANPPLGIPGQMIDLGEPGGHRGEANDLNNLSQVVATSHDLGETPQSYLWDGTIHPFATDNPYALHINDRGDVAGVAKTVGWSCSRTFAFAGTPLVTPPGGDVYGVGGMNELGHCCGGFLDMEDCNDTRTQGPTRPWVNDGVATELPMLNARWGSATDINSRGQVVGYLQPPAGENGEYEYGVLWEKGPGGQWQVYRLQDRLIGPSCQRVRRTVAINEGGEILAYIMGENCFDAAVLVPEGLYALDVEVLASKENVQLVDDTVDVTVRVTNTGADDLDVVVPAGDPNVLGTGVGDQGKLEKVSGPTPASFALAIGETKDFVYTYRPTVAGAVYVDASVTGTIDDEETTFGPFRSPKINVEGVKITEIRPVQVIYDAPLVADKPALLRVTLSNSSKMDYNVRLEAKVRALSFGQLQAGGPFEYESASDYSAPGKILDSDPPRRTMHIFPDRDAIKEVYGKLRFDVTITHLNSQSVDLDAYQQEEDVHVVKPLKLRFVPLGDVRRTDGALQQLTQQSAEFLKAIFPVPAVEALVTRGIPTSDMPWDFLHTRVEKLSSVLHQIAVNSTVDAAIGVIQSDLAPEPHKGYLASAVGQLRGFVIAHTIDGSGNPSDHGGITNVCQCAHELGHVFNLPVNRLQCGSTTIEEYCLADGIAGVPATDGYDVENHVEITNEPVGAGGFKYYNFMASPAAAVQTSQVWIDELSYEALLNKLEVPGRDPEVIVVSGIVREDGTILANPWYTFFTDAPDESLPSGSETWTVDQLAADGSVLSSFGLHALDFVNPNPSTEKLVPFANAIERAAGVKKIQIRRGSDVLYERLVSANAPVVTGVSPTGGDALFAGNQVTITWTASDADGDALTYSLFFSRDDGTDWVMLLQNTTATSFTWEVWDETTRAARLRIVATDGVNTGDYVSQRFAVLGSGQGPLVAAAGPDQVVEVGTLVKLDGAASCDPSNLDRSLTYEWRVVGVPDGGGVELSDATAPKPTFTPPIAGRYLLKLVVAANGRTSDPAYTSVSAVDELPEARPTRKVIGGDDGELAPQGITTDPNDGSPSQPTSADSCCGTTTVPATLVVGLWLVCRVVGRRRP